MTWVLHVIFSKILDRNRVIIKLQKTTKSGRRPWTSPGLVLNHFGREYRLVSMTMIFIKDHCDFFKEETRYHTKLTKKLESQL